MAGKKAQDVLTDMSVLVFNKAVKLAFPQENVKLKHVLILENAEGIVSGIHCDADVTSLKVGLRQLLSEQEVKDLIMGLSEVLASNDKSDENNPTAE